MYFPEHQGDESSKIAEYLNAIFMYNSHLKWTNWISQHLSAQEGNAWRPPCDFFNFILFIYLFSKKRRKNIRPHLEMMIRISWVWKASCVQSPPPPSNLVLQAKSLQISFELYRHLVQLSPLCFVLSKEPTLVRMTKFFPSLPFS